MKHDVLDVPDDVLSEFGAVSEQTALHMAISAREKLGASIGVSATGIAGPGGAEPGKPVGTVWLGVCTDEGAHAYLQVFEGDRLSVRQQSAAFALHLVEDACNGREQAR